MHRDKQKSEAEIQTEILCVLKQLKCHDLLDFTRISVTAARVAGGIRKPNPMRGFFDIEVVANGMVGYIEVKSANGKLSQNQRMFKATRERHGAKTLIAYSTVEVLAFLREEMGVPVTLKVAK